MKFIKSYLFIIISTLLITIVIGSLTYLNIINNSISNYLIYFLIYIVLLYSIRKISKNNGERLILITIIISMSLIINLLFIKKISIQKILYYFSIIIIAFVTKNKKIKN